MSTRLTNLQNRTSIIQRGAVSDPEFTLVELTPKRPESKISLARSEVKDSPAFPTGVKSIMTKGGKIGISLPSKLDTTVECSHVFRFKNTDSSQHGITIADLLLACGAIPTSTTEAVSLASSFRLNHVKVWPSVNSSGASDCIVQWFGPVSGVEKDSNPVVSLPEGITTSGTSCFNPPPDSFCSKWISSQNASTVLLNVQCNAGSIIDVSLRFTISNTISSVSVATTGLTVGAVVYGPLDGAASGTYIPVGLTAL
jgi:hypothetical protein